MSEHEESLKEVFYTAKKRQDELDLLDPRSEEHKDVQRRVVNQFERCRELIAKLALFSSNETLEDVSTQDIQFLAVDYLLAEALIKSYDVDRANQLKKGSSLLEDFISCLDHYEMLAPSDKRLYERYREDRSNFSVIATSNAEERRKQKISRFQEEKTLKSNLKLLRDQSMSNHVDDEVVRSLYIAELELFVHQTFQSLDGVAQELKILSQLRQTQLPNGNQVTSDSRERRSNGTGDGYSERLDGPTTMGGLGRRGGPLLSPSGKPLQPFTLTDKRTQLQQGVFRPGHNLPTMSIDEYLEEEKRRGGIIEGGDNKGQAQVEPDEDNIEQVDAATMKAREWDEFVENNPKGAGNTINRG